MNQNIPKTNMTKHTKNLDDQKLKKKTKTKTKTNKKPKRHDI